ncbi:MAG: hypothetical protein H0X43_12595 [Nitrosospira sp.]|nr:hypothetical protein [Nitrosospira sp.]
MLRSFRDPAVPLGRSPCQDKTGRLSGSPSQDKDRLSASRCPGVKPARMSRNLTSAALGWGDLNRDKAVTTQDLGAIPQGIAWTGQRGKLPTSTGTAD